ncbi:hypothetical protein GNI_167180 [Gregarina niphandrodes]|uniref:Deoxynucleoside kinase n=1 Tax=Gregarina niphandrodes TaxID=110365 RepID=A0A023AYM9_GRENI|nr:hypothetical protein GNI_167180 [Gregarina niphandrodes]EZG43553.1 hypothetical protein GNI_167180 [Gregarina niphandrodes]|eukprot:XP_011133216.1 hypothetical protein GNI_167180 [Gregarina niphandrodes]
MAAVDKGFAWTVAVDGTACVGKSTLLSRMKEEGFAVVVGDYAEDCGRYPLFRGKAQDKFLELAYFSYQWGKLQPNHVHDRGPLSALAYALIVDVMAGERTLEEARRVIRETPAGVWAPLSGIRTIILLEDDAEEAVARMRRRANGIDTMSTRYVMVQNEVFATLAERVGACVLHHRKGQDMGAETPGNGS